MSVRRVYSVIVEGVVVFSGSYAQCNSVFDALSAFNSHFFDDRFKFLIAYSPVK
ncbi:hypothetical protein [Sigmofec virus UA08Rod_5898]|uniref:Uncharacterized protein n=1 Tax=Sigmofec virus UA08Rod_5898 TaxID=2929444 RepID=A0A976R583_9VIRU|nr:hypothetical protein [Sigmofec virus UA08Rod_5898]